MSATDPVPSPQPTTSSLTERRAYVRLTSTLEALCNSTGRSREVGWPARVHDISLGGIGLLAQHRFRPGTALTVELRESTGKPLRTVTVHVVHATAVIVDGSPCWLTGCCFDCPLTEEEFATLR
jgi:hypothetical protein